MIAHGKAEAGEGEVIDQQSQVGSEVPEGKKPKKLKVPETYTVDFTTAKSYKDRLKAAQKKKAKAKRKKKAKTTKKKRSKAKK